MEFPKRCNRCHRPMKGTTAYDGACICGGLIEAVPTPTIEQLDGGEDQYSTEDREYYFQGSAQ